MTEGLASNPSSSPLHRLLEASPDLLAVADFAGRFTDLNPTWERVLGWTIEELRARPFLEFVHPADRERTMEAARGLAEGTSVQSFQNRYLAKDGSYKWLTWSAVGSVAEGRIYAIARDETQRKRAEEDMLVSRRFLDSVIESIPNMVVVKEAKGLTYVRLNRAGESLRGMPRMALIGKSDADLFPKDEADTLMAKDREVLQRRLPLDIPDESLRTKTLGLRTLHTRKVPIMDDMGEPQYLLDISEDITDWTKVQRALAAAHERLRESESLRAKLLNNVVHDLNAALTPIKLQLRVLAKTGGAAPQVLHKGLSIIDRNIEHLQRLIADLSDVGKLDAGELRLRRSPLRMDALVGPAVESFRPLAQERGIDLQSNAVPNLVVNADEGRLTRVLFNLLSNAIKFTPKDGQVRIDADPAPGQAVIRVRDTGRGLTPDEVAKLFKPFSQVHDPSEVAEGGTGLGLYISKGIVEAHGGQIHVESEGKGKGATFVIALPTHQP